MKITWEDLTSSQQAILASLQEEIPGFYNAFDGLVSLELCEADSGQLTEAGRDLLADARRRTFLRIDRFGRHALDVLRLLGLQAWRGLHLLHGCETQLLRLHGSVPRWIEGGPGAPGQRPGRDLHLAAPGHGPEVVELLLGA